MVSTRGARANPREMAGGTPALPGSFADTVGAGLAVAGEVEVEVGVVLGLAGAEHGREQMAGVVADRVQEARVVGGVVLVAADHDPALVDLERADVDGVAEAVLAHPAGAGGVVAGAAGVAAEHAYPRQLA